MIMFNSFKFLLLILTQRTKKMFLTTTKKQEKKNLNRNLCEIGKFKFFFNILKLNRWIDKNLILQENGVGNITDVSVK